MQWNVIETNVALYVGIWIGFNQLMEDLYSLGLNISLHLSDVRLYCDSCSMPVSLFQLAAYHLNVWNLSAVKFSKHITLYVIPV